MREKRSSILFCAVSFIAVVMLALAAGCIANPTTETAAGPVTAADAGAQGTPGQKQTITISGSTTVLPIVQKTADEYMATRPSADIQISGGGSGAGIKAIGAKTVDIGMSSREVKESEMAQYPGLVVTTVAQDGIAVIVNPKNDIPHITVDQIADIYLGKITTWNEIHGAGLAGTSNQIVVIGRDSASGTRSYFDEVILEGKTASSGMLEKNSNGAVLQTVAQTPGSIGYVSIGFVSNSVKAVPIWYDASTIVAPTLPNVKARTYPISRDLYVITNGKPSGPAGDFISYILGPEGQKIVADEGYVTVR